MSEGYYCVWSPCAGCGRVIGYNPHHVPSIRVKDVREPVCRSCFNRWNEMHRTSKGLDPVPLHPDAYSPAPEGEM